MQNRTFIYSFEIFYLRALIGGPDLDDLYFVWWFRTSHLGF